MQGSFMKMEFSAKKKKFSRFLLIGWMGRIRLFCSIKMNSKEKASGVSRECLAQK